MTKAKKKTIYIHEVYESIKDVRDIYKIRVTTAEHKEILRQINEGEFSINDINAKFVRRDLDADASHSEIYTEKEQKKNFF